MSTGFYVLMLAGVTWLCLWAVLPEEVRRRYWWPFDYIDEGKARPERPEQGRRRGAPASDAAAPAAAPRPASGWRSRSLRSGERARPPPPGRRG